MFDSWSERANSFNLNNDHSQAKDEHILKTNLNNINKQFSNEQLDNEEISMKGSQKSIQEISLDETNN